MSGGGQAREPREHAAIGGVKPRGHSQGFLGLASLAPSRELVGAVFEQGDNLV